MHRTAHFHHTALGGHENSAMNNSGDAPELPFDGAAAAIVAAEGWEEVAALTPAAENHGRGWQMVTETEEAASTFGDCSVFPPSLHEGLHLRPDPVSLEEKDGDIHESAAARTAEAEEEEEGGKRGGYVTSSVRRLPFSDSAWRSIGSALEVVSRKISVCREEVGIGCFVGPKIWSLAAAAGFVGVLMYLRRRHRREKELLLLLFQEKDQRINQLLSQIALMNELMAARHQVPVVKHL